MDGGAGEGRLAVDEELSDVGFLIAQGREAAGDDFPGQEQEFRGIRLFLVVMP